MTVDVAGLRPAVIGNLEAFATFLERVGPDS
jgi:hypothetical protein